MTELRSKKVIQSAQITQLYGRGKDKDLDLLISRTISLSLYWEGIIYISQCHERVNSKVNHD